MRGLGQCGLFQSRITAASSGLAPERRKRREKSIKKMPKEANKLFPVSPDPSE
jgi:hypothetical protein